MIFFKKIIQDMQWPIQKWVGGLFHNFYNIFGFILPQLLPSKKMKRKRADKDTQTVEGNFLAPPSEILITFIKLVLVFQVSPFFNGL